MMKRTKRSLIYFDRHLDASGLLCPHPLLETKKALKKLQPGEVLKITTTDPASMIDFKVFAAISTNILIHYTAQATGQYDFWLKKGEKIGFEMNNS